VSEHEPVGVPAAPAAPGWSRRRFLGMAGALAVVAQVPAILRAEGWLPAARAVEPDVVRDTVNGLVAFVVPGPDDHSRAQGEWSPTAGGLDAGGTDFLIASLDGFVPRPDVPVPNDDTVPLSAAVATLLNALALQVSPVATAGAFLSPFARLRFSDKGEVFRRIEALDLGDAEMPQPFTSSSGNLRFVGGALLEFAAFGTYSEWHAFDAERGDVVRRPVGWELTRYPGVVDGWADLRGWYQGRREVER
jgi:hypothetical protein